MLAPLAGFTLSGRILAALAVLAALVGAVWGYGYLERRAGREEGREEGRAEINAKWQAAKDKQREIDAAERHRRETAHQEIAHAAQEHARRARADAAAADRAADQLRDAYAAALERRCDPAPVAGGTSAPDTADLLADVRSGIDQAAGELARVATARGIAGDACEREYDALSAGAAR